MVDTRGVGGGRLGVGKGRHTLAEGRRRRLLKIINSAEESSVWPRRSAKNNPEIENGLSSFYLPVLVPVSVWVYLRLCSFLSQSLYLTFSLAWFCVNQRKTFCLKFLWRSSFFDGGEWFIVMRIRNRMSESRRVSVSVFVGRSQFSTCVHSRNACRL